MSEQPGPHNFDLEHAVIGAIFLDNKVLDRISAILNPEDFYEPLHAEIYGTAAKLIGDGKRATAITLKVHFKDVPSISATETVEQYLGTITAKGTDPEGAERYALEIHDLAQRRAAIIAGEDLKTRALNDHDATAVDIARDAKAQLSELAASVHGWQEPDDSILQRRLEPAPQMPLEGFGSRLNDYIEKVAEAVGSPVDYVAMAVLCAAAGLIGARRKIKIWDGWAEPAIIWGALVGDPSTNKSPAIDPVRDALMKVEASRIEGYEPEQDAYEAKMAEAKAVKKVWQKSVQRAVKDGQPVPPMPAEAREPKRPIRPRLWIANATTEKIARLLSEQPGGTINFCDELSGFIGNFDRYGGNGGDKAFWLELFGGRPYRLDRVGDGSVDVPYMAGSLIGAIQPDRLSRLVLTGDHDGFACRYLFAWPDPRPKKQPDTCPSIEILRLAFKRLGSLGDGGPITLPVEDTAVSTFAHWWTKKNDADIKAASGHLSEFHSKMSGVALRIALVFEFLKWGGLEQWTDANGPGEVSSASITEALEFVDDWAKPMARRVFAEASVPAEESNTATLARYLARERPDTINARYLRRHKRAALPGLNDARAMDAACNALCEAGWLRPCFTRQGDQGGRKTKSYDVNPRIKNIDTARRDVSAISANSFHRTPNSSPNGAKGTNGTPRCIPQKNASPPPTPGNDGARAKGKEAAGQHREYRDRATG